MCLDSNMLSLISKIYLTFISLYISTALGLASEKDFVEEVHDQLMELYGPESCPAKTHDIESGGIGKIEINSEIKLYFVNCLRGGYVSQYLWLKSSPRSVKSNGDEKLILNYEPIYFPYVTNLREQILEKKSASMLNTELDPYFSVFGDYTPAYYYDEQEKIITSRLCDNAHCELFTHYTWEYMLGSGFKISSIKLNVLGDSNLMETFTLIPSSFDTKKLITVNE